MSTDRRRPRARRTVAATLVLLSSVAAGVAGIAVATVPVLVAATTYAVVGGLVAGRLLTGEITRVRHDWARDRAVLADSHRRAAVSRAQDQIAFARQMTERIRSRDADVELLGETLRTIEDDLRTTQVQLAGQQEQRARLVTEVDSLTAELSAVGGQLDQARAELRTALDELAASQAAEIEARAEIVAWEQSADDWTRREHERRLA